MQRTVVFLFKIMPLEVMYGVMALVVPFYMLFNNRGYRAIYHFFRRRMGKKALTSVWHVYRNHFAFGQVVLDRFASYAGRRFKVVVEGNEHFQRLTEGDGGFVMLSSHVGNYEQAGYVLRPERKKIYALVFDGESEVVKNGRAGRFADKGIVTVPVTADLSHLFLLNQALDEGQVVSMPADRNNGSSKTVTCRFMGADADFPLGPFAITAQKKAPALMVAVMKEKVHRYRAFVVPIEVDRTLSHRQQMAALAQGFAQALENIVKRYPHQWYNYYEFWHGERA